MKLDSLEKLFVHELKDLYSAENQILEALPKMRDAASNEQLKEAFAEHLEETRRHVERIEKVFQGLDFKPGGEKCDGAAGLIEEGEEIIETEASPEVRDAALIGAAQRVEHYEMAGYGTTIALARKLGHHEAADLLQETLEEEGMADRKLTQIADKHINFEALVA